jgi:molybdate transport repressor ModE-like protein
MSNMSKLATSPASKPAARLPELRWHWDFGDALGEGEPRRLLNLLNALLETPALGKAAATAGMSYRAAWGLLRRCETELGLPLVLMERGRGSRLTALGESLISIDGAARLALSEAHAAWEARMQVLLAPSLRGGDAAPPRLRFYASHDLAFADWVEHGRKVMLDVAWHGSEEALAALGRGECDIAGFHVPEGCSPTQLAGWLGRWLKRRLHVVVPLMRRQQGLVVASGNPLRLKSLADVVERGARLVNRQKGSATRSLIDQLLAANGIDPKSIDGYAHEEFTHEAVAATVASGLADAGFAIEAAAARYDLGFVPLATERYGLAMGAAVAESTAGRALLARIGGNTFRQRLLAMPGYEPLPMVEPGEWESFLAG